ncbi:zinc-binding dehydrogenase [bacterium]|nr:zinc-binding dehydrogenase [bacterium]
MKAIRIHKHGGTEVLSVDEIPLPNVEDDKILVKIKATSLNHLDLWVRKGMPGLPITFPRILGCDGSGTVEKVGKLVTGFSEGERVLLQPGISCGFCSFCLCGEDHYCKNYKISGEHCDGFNAEFVNVPPQNLVKIPASMTFEEAAAIPLVFQTSYEMLVRKAKIKAGETVLVLGAGSGIGSSAIQIAKVFGAKVITTVGSESKFGFAKKLGADFVVNHSENFVKSVREITKKQGVDVVVEHVGEATWNQSLQCLKNFGRLVTCGATTGFDVKIDLRFLFIKNYRLFGSTMGSKGDFHKIIKFFESGELKAVIHKILPFTEVKAAHEMLENRENLGKVVLKF